MHSGGIHRAAQRQRKRVHALLTAARRGPGLPSPSGFLMASLVGEADATGDGGLGSSVEMDESDFAASAGSAGFRGGDALSSSESSNTTTTSLTADGCAGRGLLECESCWSAASAWRLDVHGKSFCENGFVNPYTSMASRSPSGVPSSREPRSSTTATIFAIAALAESLGNRLEKDVIIFLNMIFANPKAFSGLCSLSAAATKKQPCSFGSSMSSAIAFCKL